MICLDDPAQFGSAFDQQYIARLDFSIQVLHVIDDPLLVRWKGYLQPFEKIPADSLQHMIRSFFGFISHFSPFRVQTHGVRRMHDSDPCLTQNITLATRK
jgi:hypothetical protein